MNKAFENPKNFTRVDIVKISRDNDILYRCLRLWQSGTITYEQALQYCIVNLINVINRQEDIILDRRNTSVPDLRLMDDSTL